MSDLLAEMEGNAGDTPESSTEKSRPLIWNILAKKHRKTPI